MLVYLMFIFACGWCVCWLLFLNYQQHTQDSAKLGRLRRQLRSSRLARRHKRLTVARHHQHHHHHHDIDIESSPGPHLGLVVDSQGRSHRGRRSNDPDFRSGSLELDGLADEGQDEDSDELGLESTTRRRSFHLADEDELERELSDLEIIQMHDFDEFRSSQVLLPLDELDWPAREESEEELIRGWPGGQAHDDEPANEQQQRQQQRQQAESEDDGELVDLWPLVELHENPLNLIPHSGDGDDATARDFEGGRPLTGSRSDQALLERSRLLSLGQQEHRAAIRMISPDSVQLFVQETQLIARRNRDGEEEEEEGEEEEELGKSRQDERANNNINSNNNLLMMMQQPHAQQQHWQRQGECQPGPPAQPSIGNNDTATGANRWPSIAEGAGSAQRPAVTLAAACEGAGIERQEDRLERVDGGEALEGVATEAAKQTAGETTGDSSSSHGPTCPFIRSNREEAAGGGGGGQQQADKKSEIPKVAQVSERQLAAVVERAINLHMQSEQQSQAQVSAASTSASGLPTLQQVQRQMQAARAQLEQRQQQQQQQVLALAKPALKHGGQQRADERPDSGSTAGAMAAAGQQASGSSSAPAAAATTTKKPKTLQPSNGLGSSLPEEISPEDTRSADGRLLLKSSSLTGSSELLNNLDNHGQQLQVLTPVTGENGFDGRREKHQAGLQSAPDRVESNNLDNIGMKSDSSALPLENNNSPTLIAENKPIPTPRFQQQQLFGNELTIETRCPPPAGFGLPPTQAIIMNQRIKDLSNELSLLSTPSGQSTPTNSSMLSDCSTTISVARLLTEAEMNSSELIPKLIERLDRKLVVMKKEQFALMKEIEYNEACGQQLFDSMREQLTLAEFDKIQTHANEIEKVTKLILSLKLRLKRIEQELKAEQKAVVASQNQNEAQQQQHDSLLLNNSTSSSSSSSSSGEHPSLFSSSSERHHQTHTHNNTNTSHLPTSQLHQHKQQQTTSSTTTCDDASSCCHLALSPAAAATASKQQSVQRGVSDPTSTVGLPKRNNHHHASLQAPARLDSATSSDQVSSKDRQVPGASTSGGSDARHRKASSSSDSIFNCADSAIGSCTIIDSSASSGHGGSSSNLVAQVDGATRADESASSVGQARTPHHRLHTTDRADHLSSSLSAGSRSSLSSASTPSSPSLMSPTVSTASSSDANNNRGAERDRIARVATNESSAPIATCESLLNLISDVDILMAKRNKLVAQLEEAHQLEECIARRNNNLVERILKKYYDDKPEASSGEIALFRQFTKLKSLLLKDSHDINDRIESAEHQLSELKQTSQCQV